MMNKLLTLFSTTLLLFLTQWCVGARGDGLPFTNVNHLVIVYDAYFLPDTVTANIGDTITWAAAEVNAYSNNSVATEVPPGAYPWSSPLLGPGDSYAFIIPVAGTYLYQSNAHDTFSASFTVPGGAYPGHHVLVSDSAFTPNTFNALVGDTITWIAPTSNKYANNSVSDSIPSGAAPWNSSPLNPGQSYWYVITNPGTYTYQCSSHDTFTGRFTVTGTASGINEVANTTTQLIFQNPFGNQLRIFANTTGLVTIYNILGQKIADAQIFTGYPTEINTGGLPGGVYFIALSNNGKVLQTYKAIKAN